MTEPPKPIRGTREWAVATADCCIGCPNNCRYCYAKYEQVTKKKLISSENWTAISTIEEELTRVHPLYPGQVMFPANHDIFPENLTQCLKVLNNLIDVGNKVLIVTKPRMGCIKKLCREFEGAKDKLLFRFTITARNIDLLTFWEPGAKPYEERMACLKFSHDHGFSTSVSVEPMLDSADVVDMVYELLPFITHSLWIGKMNKLGQRVNNQTSEEKKQVAALLHGQKNDVIHTIYSQLKDNPLVRWKESIKQVVGLELSKEVGLDR